MATASPRDGLTSAEARGRLSATGRNAITGRDATTAASILLRQVASPVVWLLVGACIVAAALGEVVDALAILAIVVLNALVGFAQEFRAERAVRALGALTAPRARVVRDGRATMLPAEEVVPGDVLLLEAGDIIAADAQVLEANRLQVNEAPLTGESVPTAKSTAPTSPTAALGDRHDHVYMGTTATSGTGRAVVVATGMATELGKIAHLLESTPEPTTPLQARLAVVSRQLITICLGIVALVALAGLLHGGDLITVMVIAVSLAVAAVPESLPAIVTIALAVGVRRMAERHALVRRLVAVETLGCATVICTDKTGTLTTGVMTVREIWGGEARTILDAAAACADAELDASLQGGVGDSTEVALLVAAAALGIQRADIERTRPRVDVIPFDSERKRMSIRRSDGIIYVKGAAEVIAALCTQAAEGAAAAAADMATRGLRVLAIATGQGVEERDLRLLGLVGIADPPRPEAIAAIAEARAAGIATVMITGDHHGTAVAVARELGLLDATLAPEEAVHARASPADKLAIVRRWKAQGAVVAMTGDGVNDAPALREADVGIAMGITGTEVTRAASDIVLADDNFASIVAAVREGRGIFDNIRKTLIYLLAGNAAELLVMLIAALAGWPLPLLALHLLWINLITDGLPALALVLDPPGDDVMRKPPRSPREPMLGRAEWISILTTGLLQAAVTLGVFVWALGHRDLDEARGLAFATLIVGETLRAFAARSPTRLFWEVGALSNIRLLVVVFGSLLLQLALHHVPAAQELFHIPSPTLGDCALGLGLGFIPVSVIEVAKLIRRAIARRPGGRAAQHHQA